MDHGVLLSSTIVSGTGTVDVTAGLARAPEIARADLANPSALLLSTEFAWGWGKSPLLEGVADFWFSFGDASQGAATTNAMIACEDIPPAQLASGAPVSLAQLQCNIQIRASGGDDLYFAWLSTGSLTPRSALDADGNGQVSVQLDVTAQVVAMNPDAQNALSQLSAQLSIQALVGTATFGDMPPPPSYSGNGCFLCD
jgi:hypothetical protein